jgi:hypothetical protein
VASLRATPLKALRSLWRWTSTDGSGVVHPNISFNVGKLIREWSFRLLDEAGPSFESSGLKEKAMLFLRPKKYNYACLEITCTVEVNMLSSNLIVRERVLKCFQQLWDAIIQHKLVSCNIWINVEWRMKNRQISYYNPVTKYNIIW